MANFFARFIERGNKKIHTKLNCVSDENGKRERIIREARIPGICGEKISKRVPASFVIVEHFLRRERSILVGDKVNNKVITRVTKRRIYSRVCVNVGISCKKEIECINFVP